MAAVFLFSALNNVTAIASSHLSNIAPGTPVGDLVAAAGRAAVENMVMPGIVAVANGAALVALVAEAMDVETFARPYLQGVRLEQQPQDANDNEKKEQAVV
ncbi:hypothetical protein MN608_11867 [Microdochium nivale]|nr:hypothetical protein MN608_11867 [Microdochium nivale]